MIGSYVPQPDVGFGVIRSQLRILEWARNGHEFIPSYSKTLKADGAFCERQDNSTRKERLMESQRPLRILTLGEK